MWIEKMYLSLRIVEAIRDVLGCTGGHTWILHTVR